MTRPDDLIEYTRADSTLRKGKFISQPNLLKMNWALYYNAVARPTTTLFQYIRPENTFTMYFAHVSPCRMRATTSVFN